MIMSAFLVASAQNNLGINLNATAAQIGLQTSTHIPVIRVTVYVARATSHYGRCTNNNISSNNHQLLAGAASTLQRQHTREYTVHNQEKAERRR